MYKATLIVLEPNYTQEYVTLQILENKIRIKRNQVIQFSNIKKIDLLDDFIYVHMFSKPKDVYIYINKPYLLYSLFYELQSHMYTVIKNTYNPIHFRESI